MYSMTLHGCYSCLSCVCCMNESGRNLSNKSAEHDDSSLIVPLVQQSSDLKANFSSITSNIVDTSTVDRTECVICLDIFSGDQPVRFTIH